MPNGKQKQTRRIRRTWVKRFSRAALLIIVTLGVIGYLRPVAIMTLLQRGLLRLSGIDNKFIQLGPHRIHYLVGGEGPPLLLLHGHPSRALEWGSLLHELTRQHRVVAIDFLGYGESDAPDVDYSISTQSSIVLGLLDALGIQRTDILGFSMGGWVALKLAVDHTDRVRRLVLVDSGGLSFTTSLTAESFVPTNIEEFREMEKLHSTRRLPTFVARDVLRLSRERSWAIRRMGASLLSFRDALDGRLEKIKMPVLLVWGKEDQLIPYEVALRLKHELPQAQLVTAERCGHLVLWECPDQSLPEIISFLRN